MCAPSFATSCVIMKTRTLFAALCVLLSAQLVDAETAECGVNTMKVCCEGYYTNPNPTSGLDLCFKCPQNYYCPGDREPPRACKSPSCAQGKYTTNCSSNLDPICQACPTCPAQRWNSGCGGASAGTCTDCTKCPKGSETSTNCSALADTKCTGIPCTAQNASVCGELFCDIETETSTGRCAKCPVGWLAAGSSCDPCPKGQSCNEKGIPSCGGDCPVNTYPRCEIESNFVECISCVANPPNDSVATRGGVLDRPDTCSTYFRCKTGYVLLYSQGSSLDQSSLLCASCLVSEAGIPTFLSDGLTQNDRYSCLYDLTVGVPQQNASTNAIGYWGNYSNTCPDGMSSSAGQAPDASFCVQCPSFTPYAMDPTWWTFNCEFICPDKYNKIGQSCIPTIVPACGPGAVTVSTIPEVTCRSTPLPWNSPGYATLSDAYGTVAVSVAESTYQQTTAALAFDPWTRVSGNSTAICTAGTACTSTNGYTPYLVVSYQLSNNPANVYVFLSREYGKTNRHRLWKVATAQNKITLTKEWVLPTRVCNSAVGLDSGGNEYVYMSLCSTSFVSFVNASDVNATSWNSTRTGRVSVAKYIALLIGSVKGSGSRDGLRDEALFESTLSLAVAPMGPETKQGRLFVLDQTACRMAEVRVITPGSFLTSALTVAAGCQTGNVPIPSPHHLTTVLNGVILLFFTDNGLYQFDTALYSTQLIISADTLPSQNVKWVNVTTPSTDSLQGNVIQLWTGSATAGGATVNNSFYQLSPIQAACPNGSTSLLGSGTCRTCALQEYSAPGFGVIACNPCSSSLACPNGKFLSECSSGADATCVPCEQYPGGTLIPSHAASDKHTWSVTGICKPNYRAPCPSGYWGENTCTECPENSYTVQDANNNSAATTQSECKCSHCGYYEGGKCAIPSPFAIVNKTLSCTGLEENNFYTGDTSWTDYSGCADLVNQERCSKACSIESTTCTACGANGLYLERFAPKLCKECPDGFWGSNGLACTQCPPLRVSAANHTFCMCGNGTVFQPPEDCVCPAGHEVKPNSKMCTPCLPDFYQKDALTIPKRYTAIEQLCVKCAAGYEALSLGSTKCTPCQKGWYKTPLSNKCVMCLVPGQYATDPTDNLKCTDCDLSCQPGMRATKCPTNSPDPKYLLCTQCEDPTRRYPKLLADAWEWVPHITYKYEDGCKWRCKNEDRFFLNEDMECVACAEKPCEPGTTLVPCTSQRDGYCTQCSNSSMPTQYAVWDPQHPCEWMCMDGYRMVQKTYGLWTEYACVKEVKIYTPWWAQANHN